MTDPAGPPPALELRREEAKREDGRYIIYYTFAGTGEDSQACGRRRPRKPVLPGEGETPPCPS